MGVTGTYDVIVFSFLLPQDQILKLLPSSLRSQESFLPVPSNVINTLKSNSLQDAGTEVGTLHPVLLQMGYQISTGPGPTWIPKFSFNEAKLEVPYLRHPSGKSSLAYVLKQLMIFSNPIIKMGSSATGLRSSTATFSPSSTPSHALAGSTELQYAASGYFEATATKSADTSTASWDVYRDMMENWWFGAGTGEVTQKFIIDWENAPIKPEAYDVSIEVDLKAFAEAGSSGLEKVTTKGQGWRTKVKVTSTSAKAGQE